MWLLLPKSNHGAYGTTVMCQQAQDDSVQRHDRVQRATVEQNMHKLLCSIVQHQGRRRNGGKAK